MKREYTCIVCPNGCEISVSGEPGQKDFQIEGARCRRGQAYVMQELSDPRRTIATSVRVLGGELPLASVRLTSPIPLAKVEEAVELIHGMTLQAPVKAGTVLIGKILGYESDCVVTRDVAAGKGA